jgi:hypothetical protein
MMMKKFFLIALVALVSIQTFSQIKFGFKVGAQTLTVPTYNIQTGTNNIKALKDAAWGLQGGVFLRLKIAAIYLQPEIVFASNSFDYTVTTISGTQVGSQKFDRLQIPLLLGLKLGPFRINAGPSASIQIGSPQKLIQDANFNDLYKSALFGYQAGIGFDLFKKLTFDARFAGSLGDKYGKSITIGGQDFKLDNSETSFLLSVGWMF